MNTTKINKKQKNTILIKIYTYILLNNNKYTTFSININLNIYI